MVSLLVVVVIVDHPADRSRTSRTCQGPPAAREFAACNEQCDRDDCVVVRLPEATFAAAVFAVPEETEQSIEVGGVDRIGVGVVVVVGGAAFDGVGGQEPAK